MDEIQNHTPLMTVRVKYEPEEYLKFAKYIAKKQPGLSGSGIAIIFLGLSVLFLALCLITANSFFLFMTLFSFAVFGLYYVAVVRPQKFLYKNLDPHWKEEICVSFFDTLFELDMRTSLSRARLAYSYDSLKRVWDTPYGLYLEFPNKTAVMLPAPHLSPEEQASLRALLQRVSGDKFQKK